MSDDDLAFPLGRRNYEKFADRYAAAIVAKPHNALYERPATLSLLPEKFNGLSVLDAGCGPGLYSEFMARRGARVQAIDVTPEMVEIARSRLQPFGVDVRCADLSRPLAWLGEGEFDLVLCPLVLDYVADWRPVFAEFHRLAKPGGLLIFSAGHPMSDWRLTGETGVYYDIELYELDWAGFSEPVPRVASYRRSWEAVINPLVEAGWAIDRLLEPRPQPAMKTADPKLHDKLTRAPCFVCIRAKRS